MKNIVKINLKAIICRLLFLLFISSGYLFANGSFYNSIGYSPGLTDYYRTDPDPHTHTFKHVALGINIDSGYIFENHFGFGVDFHYGIIYKMTIFNSKAHIVVEDWDGTVSQINISPYFLYSPILRNEKNSLILGVGLSHTMNVYTSQYGTDANEYYWGISLNIQYQYFIEDNVFLNARLRLVCDFIGLWDSEPITSIFQMQYYPSLGIGFTI